MNSELHDTSEKTLSLPALGRALLFVNLAFIPVVFSRRTVEAFEFNKTALLQIVALLLCTGGLVHWLRQPRRWPGRSLLREPLCLGFALFWLSAVLSTFTSFNPFLSLRGTQASHFGLLTVTAYTVLFFATRALIECVEDMRRLLLGGVIAVSLTTTYGLVQWLGADSLTWANVSQIGGYCRPFATLGHANLLAAYLVLLFPVLLWWGWEARQRGQMALAALLGMMSLTLIVLCLSRAAWFALAAGVLVLLLGWQRRSRVRLRALGIGLALLLGIGYVVTRAGEDEMAVPLRERMGQMHHVGPRQHLWHSAGRLALERPITGWGLDTFALVFPRQRTADYWYAEWNTLPDRAHNIGLQILATQGTVGALAGLVVLIGLGVAAWRAWRKADSHTRPYVLICSTGLVAFFVQALFGFTTPALGVMAVTYAALLSRLGRRGANAARPRCCTRPVLHVVIAGLLVILGDALGAAVIDYDRHEILLGALALVLVPGAVLVSIYRTETGAIVCPQEQSAPTTGWRSVVPVGLWAGVAAVLAFWFVPHYRAEIACANGLRQAETAPIAALADLEEATQLDPDNEYYWCCLGQARQQAALHATLPLHRERLLREALAAYDGAAALVPDRAETEAARARVLRGLNRNTEAAARYERALQLDGSNPYLYLEAAQLAAHQGQRPLAQRYLATACGLYPHFEPLKQLARELAAP